MPRAQIIQVRTQGVFSATPHAARLSLRPHRRPALRGFQGALSPAVVLVVAQPLKHVQPLHLQQQVHGLGLGVVGHVVGRDLDGGGPRWGQGMILVWGGSDTAENVREDWGD